MLYLIQINLIHLIADCDPSQKNVKFIRMTWKELYKIHYKPHCRLLNIKELTLNIFTSIRKKYRPNYQRSRKIRACM